MPYKKTIGKGGGAFMNFENMFIGPLLGHRIAVVRPPLGNYEEIIKCFKKKASFVVEEKIKNKNELFDLLSKYNNSNDVLLFLDHDYMLKQRSNGKFNDILNYFSDKHYSKSDPLVLEENGVLWDLEYDEYKIDGFNEYYGRMLFVTQLDKSDVFKKLVEHYCYFDREFLKVFGESKETIGEPVC